VVSKQQKPWIVLKFGGTSVASRARWQKIAQIARALKEEGKAVLIVHSALAGVSDLLEVSVQATLDGERRSIISSLREKHLQLAADLGVDGASLLSGYFHELEQLLDGIALIGEASARVQARLMALGELMATRLGAAWLNDQGFDCTWLDARDVLVSNTPNRSGRSGENVRFLSAACTDGADKQMQARFEKFGTDIVLTQGFIASNKQGETVLLGRGGSDTSAALFAAKLQAERLEIWTDVRGMFSADPRLIPAARLLKDLSYEEAQEIAGMGAKIIHPRSLPPVRRANVLVIVKSTATPDLDGTLITNAPKDTSPRVKAIAVRTGLVLVSMTSSDMWQQPGFLARAFTAFADNDLSIDLVSTSETSVTVSLDDPTKLDEAALAEVAKDLEKFCRVNILRGCASVSLVGRGIRAILHKLTPALELFREHPVRLLSQAANDLNFTVVVDEEQAHLLAARLHDSMVQVDPDDDVFGPAWNSVEEAVDNEQAGPVWWQDKREELLALMEDRGAAYIYDLETVDRQIAALKGLKSVERSFYAMKANGHEAIIGRVLGAGLGVECVSLGEIGHVMECFPQTAPERIHFTPNFAPRSEYEAALKLGVRVTLDNLYPLQVWPEIFNGAALNVRVDPGRSRGHHMHVLTAGTRAKFGVPIDDLPEILERVTTCGAKIVGLHAHAGSGILDPGHWQELARNLGKLAANLPDLRQINLGGGLGIPARPGGVPFDMQALDDGLAIVRQEIGEIELWLEPGRYVVAEAGVLLARVTQVKSKGQTNYIGVETGMNSLIRPALYSSRHEIINLSRLDEQMDPHPVTIVGPICESADILGADRHLPATQEGDILLIADAGAYGYVMGSSYNMRAPAEEIILSAASGQPE
jgi:bifunctional diaminopimelate decarboxylase / aspartate kinase